MRQAFLFLGGFVFSVLNVSWASNREGEFNYVTNSQGAVVIWYDGSYSGTVAVPTSLGGVSVISVSNTFKYSDVRSIVLPTALQEIGSEAFLECFLLSDLDVPAQVSRIGSKAFFDCTNLRTVHFRGPTSLGSSAFENCGSLEAVSFGTLGTNAIVWSSRAFAKANKLPQITIPSQINKLPQSLFEGCSSLTNVGVLGKVGIEVHAFHGCLSLKDLVFSNEVTSIEGLVRINFYGAFRLSGATNLEFRKKVGPVGSWAFAEMPSVQSIAFYEEVKSVGASAFAGNSQLKSVVIGGGVESLGSRAFDRCPSLTNIIFYGGLKRIEEQGFADSRQLKLLVLPANLEYIGERAFRNCTGLEKLIFLGTNPPVLDAGAFQGCANLTMYYPKGAAGWSGYTNFGNRPAVSFLTNVQVTWPQAEPIQIGQRLAEVILTNGSARMAETGETVPGTFSFEEPDFQPPGGDFTTHVVFTPELWYLGEQTNTISFRVWTNIPVIQVPENLTAPAGWRFSYRIQASNNPSSFASRQDPPAELFQDFRISPDTGEISGIPRKLGTVNFLVSAENPGVPTGKAALVLKVTRGTPLVAVPPAALTIRSGQPLSLSALTGGRASNDLGTVPGKFTWLIPDRRPPAGTTSQNVRFTPSDSVNYLPSVVSVPVRVLGITNDPAPLTLARGVALSEPLRIQANFPATRFEASGLPPGLKLNAKTGQISGRPGVLGTYRTTLVAWQGTTERFVAQRSLVVTPPTALTHLQQAFPFFRPRVVQN